MNTTLACDQRFSAQARRQRGYFNICDVAALLGVEYKVFHYHVLEGHVFPPTACYGRRDKRRYYTFSDIAKIKDWWSGEK
jgi:hypothetical protein